jgi:prepilin-type N-terminal cleavage/methylation domain-containing protein
MSARTRLRAADETGFTLVELLVVVTIIGVLAAIGIASFLNQRSKAQDSQAKVYATTAAKALEVWHTDHGTYVGATSAGLNAIEPSLTQAPNLTLGTLGPTTFRVAVDSTGGTSGGGTFSLERLSDGSQRRDCTNPGAGGCHSNADASGNRW